MTAIQPEDIAIVVVLYHPSADVVFNAASWAHDTRRVIAVDNTEYPDRAVTEALRAIDGLEYLAMAGNAGVGTALNAGIASARKAGFAWVLTIDQDSTPHGRMLYELALCASGSSAGARVGLVSPVLTLENGPEQPGFEGSREVLTTITSGSLISLPAWEAVGGFDEGLFIDQVDHEFCLRLHLGGFAVLECGSARLHHRLGQMRRRGWPRRTFVTNHSALRRYYITRNRLAVTERYRRDFPDFEDRESKSLRNELVKVVLFEDHKLAKLLMSWRGYRDYRRGVTGPYAGPEVRGNQ